MLVRYQAERGRISGVCTSPSPCCAVVGQTLSGVIKLDWTASNKLHDPRSRTWPLATGLCHSDYWNLLPQFPLLWRGQTRGTYITSWWVGSTKASAPLVFSCVVILSVFCICVLRFVFVRSRVPLRFRGVTSHTCCEVSQDLSAA
jgi:hypothetical protein